MSLRPSVCSRLRACFIASCLAGLRGCVGRVPDEGEREVEIR